MARNGLLNHIHYEPVVGLRRITYCGLEKSVGSTRVEVSLGLGLWNSVVPNKCKKNKMALTTL